MVQSKHSDCSQSAQLWKPVPRSVQRLNSVPNKVAAAANTVNSNCQHQTRAPVHEKASAALQFHQCREKIGVGRQLSEPVVRNVTATAVQTMAVSIANADAMATDSAHSSCSNESDAIVGGSDERRFPVSMSCVNGVLPTSSGIVVSELLPRSLVRSARHCKCLRDVHPQQ